MTGSVSEPGQGEAGAAPSGAGQADPAGAAIGAVWGSGGLNSGVVERTKAETQKLVDAAKSGGFTLSEEGVKPLRDAITKMRSELDRLTQHSDKLTQAPKLGAHEYAHTVAEHDQKGAASAAGSATVVLRQFQEVLTKADEALSRAAGVYQDSEDQAQDKLNPSVQV